MKAKHRAKLPGTEQARWNARHPEVIRAATNRLEARNLKIVAKELEHRGGHCVYPGCTEVKIEWHHRDPSTKTASIGSSIRQHSVTRLTAELALCDPLCRRHHMIADGRLDAAANYLRTYPRIQTTRKSDSKLTEDQVREIRRRSEAGESRSTLGREFGVTQSHITGIVKRKTWKWLTD